MTRYEEQSNLAKAQHTIKRKEKTVPKKDFGDIRVALMMCEPLEGKYADYDDYSKRVEKTGSEPMSKEAFLENLQKQNERRAKERAKIMAYVKKANSLLLRTKRTCPDCGGTILHRYKRPSPAAFSATDTLIGPGTDNYGEDADPILPKVHHMYYCKKCGVVYETLPANRRKDN